MKSSAIAILLLTTLTAVLTWHLAKTVKRVRLESRRRIKYKMQIEHEIRDPAISESPYHRILGFQAAVLHSQTAQFDALSLMCLLFFFSFAAVITYLGRNLLPAPFGNVLTFDFAIFGVIFSVLGVIEFVRTRTFLADLSGEYRANATTALLTGQTDEED